VTDQQTIPDAWAERTLVDTSAEQVTFFEDRAEVVRRATCSVQAGFSGVTLLGVGVFVDDPSVVVRVRGEGVRSLGTRVLRTMRRVPGAKPDEIEKMEDELQAAERSRKEAQQALDRTNRARARTGALVEAWARAMDRIPRESAETMSDWKNVFENLGQELRTTLDEASLHAQTLRRASIDEGRAKLRLDLGKQAEPDYRAAVEVQLESAQAQQVELELVYRTPCALWRPEHMARLLTRPEGGHELEVLTRATVWQATGEVWDGVRCKFSTARPARSASPPLLTQDLLTSRRKTDTERRQVIVEERDEAIANVGIDRGIRKVEEMPGVDDGGEPVSYEASRPCTIASDGHPFRVLLSEQRMRCEVDRIGYPERTEAVHFRATATLAGTSPLLAGPLWIARGSAIVGRSKTSYVGQGEPFELGMGVDDGLRVRRTFEEKRDVTPVIGTQKIQRKIRLFVSNLSGSQRSVHLVERVPISEIEDVEVEVTSHREGRLDTRDGFAHYEVSIPPKGTKELMLEYRIEAAARVVI
jgi:uncharacterized protein (TIGR02231 family)